jgi:hypothetical protein
VIAAQARTISSRSHRLMIALHVLRAPSRVGLGVSAWRSPTAACRACLWRGSVLIILTGEVAEEEDGMDLRFWVDPETSLQHIFDHGVTEEEMRQVLTRTAEAFPGADGSRIRLGQTQAGR